MADDGISSARKKDPDYGDALQEIGRGAEAILYLVDGKIQKRRVKKGDRNPQLDFSLRSSRTRHEVKILQKAKAAQIPVPDAIMLDEETILLEKIEGFQLKSVLDSDPLLAHSVGRIVAKMHENHIIHEDLTTSNILVDESKKHLTLIDFGLSYISQRDEDKATDLHLFHQSLESKHHAVAGIAWRHFLKGYRDSSPHADIVIDRLRKVEARGRNKAS